jgi:hypothetical protein
LIGSFSPGAAQDLGNPILVGRCERIVSVSAAGEFSLYQPRWFRLDLDHDVKAANAIHLHRDDTGMGILALPTNKGIVNFRGATSVASAQSEFAR